jgi:capsular exopolysaccharide synthesis family protein
MMQDNRLMPLSNAPDTALDRPLQDMAARPYRYYGAAADDANHLRDYFRIVMKRKWIILTLALVATSLATVHMYRQPSIFESSAMLQIEPKKDSVLKTSKDGGLVINANTKDPAYINTQLRLLQSPALSRQVILTLGLQNDPHFLGGQAPTGIVASLRRLLTRDTGKASGAPPAPAVGTGLTPISEDEAKNIQFTPEQLTQLEPYEDALALNLETEQIPLTNLINLKFKHTSPEMAQKIVNTLADTFVYNNQARDLIGSEKNLETLSKTVAELQQQVKEKELKRYNYIKAHGLPENKSPAANMAAERLMQLSKQLAEAENERKTAQAEYDAAKNRRPEDLAEAQNSAYADKLREELAKLNQRERELSVTYTREWPEMKKIEEQKKQVQADLDKATMQRPREVYSSLISAAKARYDAAAQKESSLRQSFNQARAEYSAQNSDTLDLSMMEQELETDKQYLNTLQQRLREMEGTSGDTTRANNIKVETYSRQPSAPIGPARMRNIALAGLLSLFAGVGLAFLLHYLDDTVKTVDDVDRYLHLPALALIPSNRAERPRLKGETAPANSTALALLEDARSPQAEAYRHLRTSLLLSSAGQPPKTILVTSSQPSEGKTTTAVNTAIMLAQTGASVVILDCDLRRPRIHAHFQMPNQRGISNFLSGDQDLDAMLQPHPQLPNLNVLSSGPVPPNPAELLGSDQMRKLLTALSQRFTHVIVDSPPCISFTDASILSTMVDGVMLVIHSGRSSRAVVRRAKQQLMDVGAHIFGIVLNNVKAKESDYYYYGGSYASYYEDEEEED